MAKRRWVPAEGDLSSSCPTAQEQMPACLIRQPVVRVHSAVDFPCGVNHSAATSLCSSFNSLSPGVMGTKLCSTTPMLMLFQPVMKMKTKIPTTARTLALPILDQHVVWRPLLREPSVKKPHSFCSAAECRRGPCLYCVKVL